MATLLLSLAFLYGASDLDELAKRREIQWSCETATGRHTLHCGGNTLVFSPGFQTALVNGVSVPLATPVSVDGGRLRLPPELMRYVEAAPPKRAPAPIVEKPRGPSVVEEPVKPRPGTSLAGTTIAIDPGHGGVHTGGKGPRGLMEKDINLGVSLQLQKILESWGARVVMTRTIDGNFDNQVDDDLDARVQIVNGARPDLFLSIHTNYVGNPGPRGFEVWVPRCTGTRDRQSRELADLLRGQLGGVWGPGEDRGTKDDHNLRVLKGTRCPAALVELEFVSNPAVERMLGQEAKQKELAAAIAEAARSWVRGHLR